MTHRAQHYSILVFSLILCTTLILGCTDTDVIGPESQDAETVEADA